MGRKDAKSPMERHAGRILAALEWPGMLGWLGAVFGAAGLWFVASYLALGSCLSALEESGTDVRCVADRARWLGFGDRHFAAIADRDVSRPAVDETTRLRLRMAVGANARSSIVFGACALFLCAFLWGLRLLEPSVLSERTERASPQGRAP